MLSTDRQLGREVTQDPVEWQVAREIYLFEVERVVGAPQVREREQGE